jgi:chaperonin GroES
MKIEPMGERVLIERNEVSDVSEGGIFLPGNTNKKEQRGVVVELGDCCDLFEIGDKVIYADFEGTLISDGKKSFVIVNENKVVAKYTD